MAVRLGAEPGREMLADQLRILVHEIVVGDAGTEGSRDAAGPGDFRELSRTAHIGLGL